MIEKINKFEYVIICSVHQKTNQESEKHHGRRYLQHISANGFYLKHMKSSLIQTPHTCHIVGSTNYVSTDMRGI